MIAQGFLKAAPESDYLQPQKRTNARRPPAEAEPVRGVMRSAPTCPPGGRQKHSTLTCRAHTQHLDILVNNAAPVGVQRWKELSGQGLGKVCQNLQRHVRFQLHPASAAIALPQAGNADKPARSCINIGLGCRHQRLLAATGLLLTGPSKGQLFISYRACSPKELVGEHINVKT